MTRSALAPLVLQGAFIGALLLPAAGCGDSGQTGTGGAGGAADECIGGIVVDGVCEGKCTPDACVENNVCVHNRCKLQCSSHDECLSTAKGDSVQQGCLPEKQDTDTELDAGDTVYVCTDVNVSLTIGKSCPLGNECGSAFACPDGSPCEDGVGSDKCDAAQCRALVCLGSGEGDADAYCTNVDCATDADCAPGDYCTVERFANNICGTDKGDGDPCIAPADFNKDGATWQEGPVSILRNICKKREPCAPCVTKTDCSLSPDMECVKLPEGQVCAKTCNVADDCPNDFQCASGFCVPGTGTCTPPATDNFCYSCINDLQCGPGTGTSACIEVSGKQRACFDTSFPDTCTTDNDCPASPSTRHGECLDEGEGLAQGDDLYHHCYFPFLTGSGSYECWTD